MHLRSTLRHRAPRFLFAVWTLWLGTLSLVLAAEPTQSGPKTRFSAQEPTRSPALRALEQGDFENALRAAKATPEEQHWIQTRIHLAQFEWEKAEASLQRLPQKSVHRAELAWLLAHGRRDPAAIAETATQYCDQGDPTGRACADAEFYAHRIVNAHLGMAAPASLPMIEEAPFPMLRAQIGSRVRGVVLDTGASQSVVSTETAHELGLAMTERAFPIAVAGGEGITQARLAVLPVVNFGPMQVWTLPVLVVDMPMLDALGIGLILSPQQAFDGHQVAFDFPRAEVRVGPADARPTSDELMEIPYLAAGFDLVVRAQVAQGPKALFGLDTGMEGPFAVSSRYWDELKGAPDAKAQIASSAVLYGAGGDARVEAVSAELIRLGTTEVQPAESGVRTEMTRHGPFEIAGLLGNGLWRDRLLVLDTQNHYLRLGAAAIP